MSNIRIKDLEGKAPSNNDVLAVDNNIASASVSIGSLTDHISSQVTLQTTNDVGLFFYGTPKDSSIYLELNGGVYNKIDYPDLVELWDNEFGVNGGSLPASNNWYNNNADQTKFKVPNLYIHGESFRGLSSEHSYSVGDILRDQFQGHTMQMAGNSDAILIADGTNSSAVAGGASRVAYFANRVTDRQATPSSDGVNGTPRVGAETRGAGFVTRMWVQAKPKLTIAQVQNSSLNATDIGYANTTTGLDTSNVQGAIDLIHKSSIQGIKRVEYIEVINAGDPVELVDVASGIPRVRKLTKCTQDAYFGIAMQGGTENTFNDVVIAGRHTIEIPEFGNVDDKTIFIGSKLYINNNCKLIPTPYLNDGFIYLGYISNVSGNNIIINLGEHSMVNNTYITQNVLAGTSIMQTLDISKDNIIILPNIDDDYLSTNTVDVDNNYITFKHPDRFHIVTDFGLSLERTTPSNTTLKLVTEYSTDGNIWETVPNSLEQVNINYDGIFTFSLMFINKDLVDGEIHYRLKANVIGVNLNINNDDNIAGYCVKVVAKKV